MLVINLVALRSLVVSCESQCHFRTLFILVVCNITLYRLCVAIGGHGHGYVNFMCNGMLGLW